jgi:hypothetical protein
MKVQSKTGGETVVLVRAGDGARITVANGTDVIAIDDMGDPKRLRKEYAQHVRDGDFPVLMEGELHFVHRGELV